VKAFKEFTPDSDPHGEYDFGWFEIGGVLGTIAETLAR